MAKRYASYEYLLAAHNGTREENGSDTTSLVDAQFKTNDLETSWRFPRTLGRHGFVIETHQDGLLVTGVDSGYNDTISVIIYPGQTLGYDCGEVWFIPDPSTIKDPLRRVLLQHKLGKNRVVFVDKEYIHKFDNDYLSLGEGYVTFCNGESCLHKAHFGFVTQVAKKTGPIDQRYYLGNFYVLKGTPRAEVANFVEDVMNDTWNYTGVCAIPLTEGEVRDIQL